MCSSLSRLSRNHSGTASHVSVHARLLIKASIPLEEVATAWNTAPWLGMQALQLQANLLAACEFPQISNFCASWPTASRSTVLRLCHLAKARNVSFQKQRALRTTCTVACSQILAACFQSSVKLSEHCSQHSLFLMIGHAVAILALL